MKTMSLDLRWVVLVCLLVSTPAIAKERPAAGAKPVTKKQKNGAKTLPSAESILDRFVNVTGGKEAYAKYHSEVAQGTFELAPLPPGTMKVQWTAPGNYHKRIELAVGVVEEGVRDSVCWQRVPGQVPAVLEGAERRIALGDARLFAEPDWRAHYTNVRVVSVDSVEALPAYRLEMTDPAGRAVTAFYDRESGLLVKRITPGPTAEAPPASELVSDYREVSGVRIPFRLVSRLGAQTITKQLTSVELNVDLGEHEFELPEELGTKWDR